MLKVTHEKEITIAAFDNYDRFNAIISQEVKDKLNSLVVPDSKLILDLSGVKFIDSSGYGAMLSVFKNARKSNSIFRICNIIPDVMEVVKLMQLHNVFDIYDSLADCLESFK
ncbi:MAG: STAS domain-containing protein [Bacteroidales bacterium]|nr:STAS domain-containing protein [Bacteroidales bacterium]